MSVGRISLTYKTFPDKVSLEADANYEITQIDYLPTKIN